MLRLKFYFHHYSFDTNLEKSKKSYSSLVMKGSVPDSLSFCYFSFMPFDLSCLIERRGCY